MEFSPRKGETILAEGNSVFNGKKNYLIHVEAGIYPAGSRTRHEKERWSIVFMSDNARHGTGFKSLADAERFFNKKVSIDSVVRIG